MASSSNFTYPKQRKHFPIERRPTMLKDFLLEDFNSCSSSGFKSLPRGPAENPTLTPTLTSTLSLAKNPHRRTRSNAFRAIINAVKSIHFAAVKSPSILPRSLSRRLSSNKNSLPTKTEKKESEVEVTVRVKDIIRWRSFRDLIEEEKSPPLDSACSPHHCTTTTTTTGSTTTSSSSSSTSNSSSWCDSDFTSEFLPPWGRNSDDQGEKVGDAGKNYLPAGVGKEKDSVESTTGPSNKTKVGPKHESACDEKDYQSPVSILDFQFEEYDGGSVSSFDQSLANMQKTKQKLMHKLHHFEILAKVDPLNLDEWMSSMEDDSSSKEEEEEEEEGYDVEEKAMEMLSNVKVMCSIWSCKSHVEQLLLDFFTDELTANTSKQSIDKECESEIIKRAKAWMKGEDRSAIEVGKEIKREGCVREMDKRRKWESLEEEQEELALEIESDLLDILVDEVLTDLCSHPHC